LKTIIILKNEKIIHKTESVKCIRARNELSYNSQISAWKKAEAIKLNVYEIELLTRYLKQKKKSKKKSTIFYLSNLWKEKRARVLFFRLSSPQ